MRSRFILVFVGCLLAVRVSAQSPVGLTIDTQSPGVAITPDFGVFSFETGSLQFGNPNYNPDGYFFNSTNTQLITLFQNIGARSIRVGGNSVDGNYIPSNADIDSLYGFARAAGVQVVFSLDLKGGMPAEAVTEGQYVWNNYRTNTTCLAIGNEPNAYNDNGTYPTITNFSTYISQWQGFASAVVGAVPDVTLGGPDNDSTAISWSEDFARAEQGVTNVSSINYHFKPGGSANGLTLQQMISGMLSTNMDSINFPIAYGEIGEMAQSLGYSYRFTEFNAYVAPTNNPPGEYTPYGSALYALDTMHWWAAKGCLGLHFHTGILGFLATFYVDSSGNYQVYPVCYGIAAFNVSSQGNAEPLTITNVNGLNLTAYAVGGGTNLYVTIVNRENGTGARNAAVTIAPSGFVAGSVAAMSLVQASGDVTATNGITLGGAPIAGTGPWLGQWTPLGFVTNGQCTVTIPAASAAVVRIQASTLFAPPVIVTNLPIQAMLQVGKTNVYSIEVHGAAPLSYQWYQGGTLLAGQTNSTYAVTAGVPGTNTYQVIITNSYGAVTSVVSTLTVFSQPTQSLATAIQQLNPAGYWPMHEVEVPAAGDIETNYGTLGVLGTGYYPDWAVSTGGIVRQAPGPMSGDSDSDLAAQFTHSEITGTTVEFTNGVFIPHASPSATLNPPFSVECWFYPTSSSTGVDIWAQNGYEGLNAGNEGGIIGNICGIRLVWANATFVVYGYDNQFDLGTQNSDKLAVENTAQPINQWYHLVVTCDANMEFTLFVNGTILATGAGGYSPDYWTPLSIGSGLGQTRSIAGYISEFSVYTNVLQDVSYHHSVGTSPSPGTNYFAVVTNDNPAIYLRMQSPAYTSPPRISWPVMNNLGTTNGVAVGNGVYSPGTMPGVMSGPITSSGSPSAGVTNNSALLSGVSSFGDAGSAPVYNPTGSNANFSVTVLFRGFPCDGRVQTIVGHGNNSWQLTVTTNGCLVFNAGNGHQLTSGTGQAAGDIMTQGIYNDGNWHQVVAVNRANVVSIYVDGALDTNGTPSGVTATTTIPGNSSDVMIGSDPSYTNNPVGVGRSFAGQICDVAFFTNALTTAQVQAIYEAASVPASLNQSPTKLAFSLTGNQLNLSWPADHIGWTLQAQTNEPSAGLRTNWVDVSGSTLTNQVVVPVNLTNGSVFYRLVYP